MKNICMISYRVQKTKVYNRGGEPAAFYVLKCGLLTESKFYRTNPFIFINTFLFVF
jgi:hypothetical protein